jgi:hypothetical protein
LLAVGRIGHIFLDDTADAAHFDSRRKGNLVMNIRKNLVALGLAGSFGIWSLGCDKAPESKKLAEDAKQTAGKAAEKIEETVEKGVEAAKKGAAAAEKAAEDAIQKAKEEFAKFSDTHLEDIQKKIKELSGDALTEAQAMYTKVKEKLAEIKESAPEKWEELKKDVEDSIAELKKKVGL